MDSKGIFEALQAKFGEDVVFGYEPPKLATLDDHFFVKPERLTDVAKHLRDDPKLDFDYLECVTGVDYPNAPVVAPANDEQEEPEKGTIHVVYHLRSYDKKHRAVVKVSLSRQEPRVATLSDVWSAANWQERECYDLLGVQFDGHPDLRRIMLPDDWEGYPLRKDYVEKPEYHGIPTTRPNPFDLLVINKKPAKAAAKPAAKKAPAKKADDKKADDKKADDKNDKKADKKADDKKADDKKADDKKADDKKADDKKADDKKADDKKADDKKADDKKADDKKADDKKADDKKADDKKADDKKADDKKADDKKADDKKADDKKADDKKADDKKADDKKADDKKADDKKADDKKADDKKADDKKADDKKADDKKADDKKADDKKADDKKD